MEYTSIIGIIQSTVPAILVLAMGYLMLKAFFENERDNKQLDIAMKAQNATLPVRFQAYERLILLMERTAPFKLLSRFSSEDLTVPEYQLILITAIRQELDHNLTQQLYISVEGWAVIRSAIEELIGIINTLAKQLPNEASGRDLANLIIEYFKDAEVSTPNGRAIHYLKLEAKGYMG